MNPTSTRIEVTGSVVQLMGSIGHGRGGLTKAVYARLNALDESVPIVVAVTGIQADVEVVFEELKVRGSIPQRARLATYLEDLRSRQVAGTAPEAATAVSSDFRDADRVVREAAAPGTGDILRHYKHGRFLGLERFDESGRIQYSDIHRPDAPHIPSRRDRFGGQGELQSQTFLSEDFKPRYQVFMGNHGVPVLSAWVSPSGKHYRIVEHGTDNPCDYADMDEARAEWIQRVIAENGPDVTVFSDEPVTMHALIGAKRARARVSTIAVIHTVHFANNANNDKGVKPWFPQYRHRQSVDKVVVTTEAQRRDLERLEGEAFSNRTFVVRHAAPAVVGVAWARKEQSRIAIVGRLDPNKRIDLAIQAFAIARRTLPKLFLDIVGEGADRPRLEALVKELDLAGAVTISGYQDDVMPYFERAGLQLFTSKFEGFGLVLTEGFSRGVPVVAVDVPYGPRDLVQDGVNGYLARTPDANEIGALIVRAVSDRKTWQRLSDGALKTASRFGEDEWARDWTHVLAA